jgi:hypothetical protein
MSFFKTRAGGDAAALILAHGRDSWLPALKQYVHEEKEALMVMDGQVRLDWVRKFLPSLMMITIILKFTDCQHAP